MNSYFVRLLLFFPLVFASSQEPTMAPTLGLATPGSPAYAALPPVDDMLLGCKMWLNMDVVAGAAITTIHGVYDGYDCAMACRNQPGCVAWGFSGDCNLYDSFYGVQDHGGMIAGTAGAFCTESSSSQPSAQPSTEPSAQPTGSPTSRTARPSSQPPAQAPATQATAPPYSSSFSTPSLKPTPRPTAQAPSALRKPAARKGSRSQMRGQGRKAGGADVEVEVEVDVSVDVSSGSRGNKKSQHAKKKEDFSMNVAA